MLVIGLERIVDIECFDPVPVNLFLVNIFNFIFVYFFVLVSFILFFFLVLFFLFGLIFCIYCFIIPSIFCVVIICSLLCVISIIFLCYALRKLDLGSHWGNLLSGISFDLLVENFFIFIRNDAVLFQNALSDFLYTFSNRSFSLSEHKIALELWLVLPNINNLLNFLTIRHVLNNVLYRFFFTRTVATRIHNIFGIETNQLIFT